MMRFRVQFILATTGKVGSRTFATLPEAVNAAAGWATIHKRVAIYLQKDGEGYETLLHEYHKEE